MTAPSVTIFRGTRPRITLRSSGVQGATGLGRRFTVAGTSLTLSESERGALGEFTAGTNVTITVPTGLSDYWEASFVQVGAGTLIVAPSGGVSIASPNGHRKSYEQYSVITLIRRAAANSFLLLGDLKA